MNTRRTFLQTAAAVASAAPAATTQIPKMKFFGAEIGRMVMGTNQFYGYAHFNNILATVMREFYTPEKVCEVLHQACRYGINAFNYVALSRAPQDWARFTGEGGKMHLIMQGINDDPGVDFRAVEPLAIYRHGERTDKDYQAGKLHDVREWCKKVRQLGMVVGVGTHKPEVIAQIESEAWDVDFYAGCVYNRTRTPDEWRKVLGGEMMEMAGEIYVQSDPARMYKVMRQTSKPCFAFKIMAAGRITDKGADQAFQTAFESVKPTDGIIVGMFPRVKDEIKENVERVAAILNKKPVEVNKSAATKTGPTG